MRWPNGTADGHATSQPRHSTHASIAAVNAASIGAPPSCTARIAAMRPRGDAISSPVTRYVGQAGRQSPHATQATSSSSSAGWRRHAALRSEREPAGVELAGRVERVLDPRAARARFGERDAERVEAGCARPRAAASRPRPRPRPRARGEPGLGRRRRRARCRRRPRRARCSRRRRGRRASAASAPGRTEIRPRCGPVGPRGRRVDRSQPGAALLARRRRRGGPRAARACGVPSQARHDGPEEPRRAARPARASLAAQLEHAGRGWVRSVTCTITPSVPSEPTSSRGRS